MPLLFEPGRIDSMPKKIDPQLRARCVRLVRNHAQEYPTLTAAVTAIARWEDKEILRRASIFFAGGELDPRNR